MRQVRAPVAVRRSGAQVHMLTPCERWAGEHELQMSVGERPRWVEAPRYFAKFDHVGVSRGCGLLCLCGEGASPEAAIEDYLKGIAGELLVVNAFSGLRREIQRPNEWGKE